MVSTSLFVLLLATYAYSVPLNTQYGMFKNNVEVSTSQPAVMHLIDNEDSTNVANLVQDPLVTGRGGLQLTTQDSLLNKQPGSRRFWQPLVQSSTVQPSSTFEPSSTSGFVTRGIVEPLLQTSTIESSSQSGFVTRGIVEPLLQSSTIESSSQSGFATRGIVDPFLQSSTIESSSTLFLPTVESSTQFNARKIRGQNNNLWMNHQTTEVPSSSVSSFATTTGLLRQEREEPEPEESEPVSMGMNEVTTGSSKSTGQPKTVIEIFPGLNTETKIIQNIQNRPAAGKHELSQGKKQ